MESLSREPFLYRYLVFFLQTVAIAILSGYTGLYCIYSISSMFSSKKKEAPKPVAAAAPAAAAASSEGIPSVESDDFVTFVESEAFAKLLDSEDQLKALTE